MFVYFSKISSPCLFPNIYTAKSSVTYLKKNCYEIDKIILLLWRDQGKSQSMMMTIKYDLF